MRIHRGLSGKLSYNYQLVPARACPTNSTLSGVSGGCCSKNFTGDLQGRRLRSVRGLQHFQYLADAPLIIHDCVHHLDAVKHMVRTLRNGDMPRVAHVTIESEYVEADEAVVVEDAVAQCMDFAASICIHSADMKSILNSLAPLVEAHVDNVLEFGLDGRCALYTLRQQDHKLCARFCHGTVILLKRVLRGANVSGLFKIFILKELRLILVAECMFTLINMSSDAWQSRKFAAASSHRVSDIYDANTDNDRLQQCLFQWLRWMSPTRPSSLPPLKPHATRRRRLHCCAALTHRALVPCADDGCRRGQVAAEPAPA